MLITLLGIPLCFLVGFAFGILTPILGAWEGCKRPWTKKWHVFVVRSSKISRGHKALVIHGAECLLSFECVKPCRKMGKLLLLQYYKLGHSLGVILILWIITLFKVILFIPIFTAIFCGGSHHEQLAALMKDVKEKKKKSAKNNESGGGVDLEIGVDSTDSNASNNNAKNETGDSNKYVDKMKGSSAYDGGGWIASDDEDDDIIQVLDEPDTTVSQLFDMDDTDKTPTNENEDYGRSAYDD